LAGSKVTRYGGALLAIACATAVALPFRAHVNVTTVALALLLAVLFAAIAFGSKPALAASVVGMLCFNFFFLPPYHTLTIADPQNWVALTAFFITAVTVGQLSARAKRRAEEAEAGRIENRRLYDELREAFDRASEAEAIKRSERLKSALLDAVTHDIRTPLTSIKASATLLLEDRDETESSAKLSEEEQHAILEVIEHSANRLDRFVEGIVDLARIEAGDISLHRNWGAVEDIIEAALAQAEPLTRNHKVKVSVAEELPVIRVDARTVTEVIYTLVDNASKYAPHCTTITIGACRPRMTSLRFRWPMRGQASRYTLERLPSRNSIAVMATGLNRAAQESEWAWRSPKASWKRTVATFGLKTVRQVAVRALCSPCPSVMKMVRNRER
jgi:two-component system sensor histidine kinase KdpD